MSRSHADIVNADKARTGALQRMLRVGIDASSKSDGTDIVREALDDAQFIRDLAKTLHADAGEDGDDAELGRRVRARVIAYCESCPVFEDYVEQELADLSDTSDEDEERDADLEREPLAHS